ncbi:MAG: DUF362 domain-containing protein [Candidatus Helarchaeota archaeon]|nr:DUF362 domain-containing protein [Candidatus Helarchaeota archaeon]
MVDVALVKGEKIQEAIPMYDSVKVVKQALDLLGGMESFVKKDDYVVIKPNYGVPIPRKHYAVPLSTSPGVIEGIILEAQRAGARKVGIAEGLPRTGMVRSKAMLKKNETSYNMVFTACGGMMLKEKYPDFVELRLLEIEPRTKMELPGASVMKEFNMWQAFIDCDLFINVPIMKTHFITGCATLAIKNLHGIVGDYMHLAHRNDFWMAKVDISKWLIDNNKWRLTVIDGLAALEGNGPGPMGKQVDMGVIVASSDFVAADTVAMATMGLNALEQPGDTLAAWKGLGTVDLKKIEVKGAKIDDVKRPFLRPNINILGRWPNIEVILGGVCDHCKGWLAMEVDSFFKSIRRKAARAVKKIKTLPEAVAKALTEFSQEELLANLDPGQTLKIVEENTPPESEDKKQKKARKLLLELADHLRVLTVPTQIFIGDNPPKPSEFVERVVFVGDCCIGTARNIKQLRAIQTHADGQWSEKRWIVFHGCPPMDAFEFPSYLRT